MTKDNLREAAREFEKWRTRLINVRSRLDGKYQTKEIRELTDICADLDAWSRYIAS